MDLTGDPTGERDPRPDSAEILHLTDSFAMRHRGQLSVGPHAGVVR